MPVLGVLLVVLQIAFAVHVVRSGRETFWLYIIVFLPGIGCAVYFLTQILPELGNSRAVRQAGASVRKTVDPHRDLRARHNDLDVADTLDNRVKLSAEYALAGRHEDARELLETCREQGYADDPYVLLPLAQSQFELGAFAEAQATLDHLIAANPQFSSHDGHLLYARTLEALDAFDAAAEEYDVLCNSYPGEEARVRYAQMLQRNGRSADARALFEETLARTSRAPKYYRKRQQRWISEARAGLAGA